MSKTTDSISSTCVLCCNAIKYYAIGPCNHHICLKCSTRMRVLCNEHHCSVCRAEMPKVIATAKLHPYDGIILHKYPYNHKAQIAFANPTIQNEFKKLLCESCLLCTHRLPEKNCKELQEHLRKAHELFYCDLCIQQLKVFPSERKSYNRKDLALHRRKGDGKDTSYRGHPLCEFCDDRYFDNDELLRHLRQQHYFCHFCEKDGVSNQYYNDYTNLKEHFRTQHYLCVEDQCEHEQFTHAFRSEIDLRAHKATTHIGLMSKAQARQMRQLDIQINLSRREPDRGFESDFKRGRLPRDRNDLSAAIHASRESARQEIAVRVDASKARNDAKKVKQEAAERADTKKPTNDARKFKQNTTTTADNRKQTNDARKVNAKKTNSDDQKMKENISGACVRESTSKNAVENSEEERMSKKMERASSQLESRKISHENGSSLTKTEKTNIEVNDLSTDNAVQKINKIKQNKTAKKINTTDTKMENTVQDEVPVSTILTGEKNVFERDEVRAAKPTKAMLPTRITADGDREDFPALSGSKVDIRSDLGIGFNFYCAFQNEDSKPQPPKPAMNFPKQKTFKQMEDDFPSLSSIAGILGASSVPSAAGKSVKKSTTYTTSAWTSTNKSHVVQTKSASEQGTAKSRRKGNKSPGTKTSSSNKATDVSPADKNNGHLGQIGPGPLIAPSLKPHTDVTPSVSPVPVSVPQAATLAPHSNIFVAPPPGFSAAKLNSPSKLPPGLTTYVHPPDFQQRNIRLAHKIKDYLGHEGPKFDTFRLISRRFREGSMTGVDYYNECKKLLKDNLAGIFNELVSLLPDLDKQQELIFAQNVSLLQEKKQKDEMDGGRSQYSKWNLQVK